MGLMNANGMPGMGANKGASKSGLMEQMMQAGKLVFDSRVPFSLKLMLPIAAALYWLWPLDLMPGLPFDDVAVLFVAMTLFVQLANQAIGKQTGQQPNSQSAGSQAQPSSGSNDVVDTTWRVID